MAKVGTSTVVESCLDTERITLLLDTGDSRHYFDDELHPGLKNRPLKCKELRRPHTIATAGRHVLLGTATATAFGVIVDESATEQ